MKTLKLLGAALAAVTMTFTAQAAKTAKAVVQDGGTTLKFVYDDNDYGTKGTDWYSVAEAEAIDSSDGTQPWYGASLKFTSVIIDSSFKDYKPKQCALWFYYMRNVTAITGLENLDTSAATDMKLMFGRCSSIPSLDLDTFDTSNVTNTESMFQYCSKLGKVVVSGAFNMSKVEKSTGMFTGCTNLVGGVGTVFDKTHTDKSYARIDGGPSAPGYFTAATVLPEGSYCIHFDANGGTGTMADQICTRDKVYNLTKCAFTRTSGKFVGWRSSKNGKLYADGILVFDLAEPGETVTMTAVWELDGVQLWADGPYWAECNVGAAKPEDYGYYFWWGDTVGYKRVGDSWNASDGSKTAFSFNYSNCLTFEKIDVELFSEGFIDGTRNLAAAHDAATKHLGAPWRLPTAAEIQALIDNCDGEWTMCNEVAGWLVKGRGAFASKSIFLPATGYGNGTSILDPGSGGCYWTSTPSTAATVNKGTDWGCYARSLNFVSGSIYMPFPDPSRFFGMTVRPVR